MSVVGDLPALVAFDGCFPLTEDDLCGDPDAALVDFLQSDADAKGISRPAYHVLDFGCARGKSVALLRKRGWLAFGIDIDPRFIASGALVTSMAKGDLPILSEPDERGRTIFDSGFFDAIVSDQVLEHVSDIDRVALEIGRLLKPGGVCLLQFPARYCVMETHYDLPLVHWLPKNSVRRLAIRLLIGVGFRTLLPQHLSAAEKTQVIYNYSCQNTFYRSRKKIRDAFMRSGIGLDWQTMPRKRAAGRLVRLGIPQSVAAHIARIPGPVWWLNTFRHCMAIGHKQISNHTQN
jgi:SAM-dependent methyltransferase